mgnify:CR=1 FL=1
MKTKRTFIPCFTSQRSIITYRMQQERRLQTQRKRRQPRRNPAQKLLRDLLRNPEPKRQGLPAQSWTIYISRRTRFLQIMRMYGTRCLAWWIKARRIQAEIMRIIWQTRLKPTRILFRGRAENTDGWYSNDTNNRGTDGGNRKRQYSIGR